MGILFGGNLWERKGVIKQNQMVYTVIFNNVIRLLHVRSRQIYNPSRKWKEKFQIDHITGELGNLCLLIPFRKLRTGLLYKRKWDHGWFTKKEMGAQSRRIQCFDVPYSPFYYLDPQWPLLIWKLYGCLLSTEKVPLALRVGRFTAWLQVFYHRWPGQKAVECISVLCLSLYLYLGMGAFVAFQFVVVWERKKRKRELSG